MSAYTITISRHAVDRFVERARPGLDHRAAEDEIARLAPTALVLTEPPAWLARAQQAADGYLVIADLVLPLRRLPRGEQEYVATTCIARGSLSDPARARRTRAKRARRRHRSRATGLRSAA